MEQIRNTSIVLFYVKWDGGERLGEFTYLRLDIEDSVMMVNTEWILWRFY